MTHDLLELAQDLSDASTRQSNGFYTPDLPSLGFSAAAALRAAHEELTIAREAYTNIGTERDNLQLECEQLRAELLERKETHRKTLLQLTDCQIELTRLRELVKRHEDALDEANMADGSVVDNDRLHIDFPCECTYWCHVVDLDGVHTSHHENCPKRNPLEEAKVIISNLVRGIRLWASEEDGVYDEVWHDYLHALLFLQRNADFIAALKADKINNPEGYAAIEAAMKEEK